MNAFSSYLWYTYNIRKKVTTLYLRKIIKALLVLVLLLSVVSCKKKQEENNTLPTTIEPTSIVAYYDVTLDNVNASSVPFLIQDAIYNKDEYETSTTGQTVAKVLIKYTQKIKSAVYKSGNKAYLLNESNSTLVNAYLECYFGDNVKYREKSSGDYKTVSYEEYHNLYGIIPTTKQVDGYIFTLDSIISVVQEDRNVYLITINGELAGGNNKINMKQIGGLKDYPVFESLTMRITIDEDFFPTEIKLSAKYSVKMALIGNANCFQEYTVTFKALSDEGRSVLQNV